jgi:GAF domain-containing protein
MAAAIVAIAQQIAAERDPRALLNQVCDAAREVTLAQHAVINELSDDGSAFRRVTTSGIDEETVARLEGASVDAPVFRDVIARRRPVRLRNPGGRPEAIGLPATQPATHSTLAVPIASPTQVYGCLSLRNKLGADSFSDRDEEVALTLATHAGIAYENARLNDDLRRHGAALEREVVERRRAEARTQVALAAARMGISGTEFLERFRAMPQSGPVPVIVWTVKDLSPLERARLLTLAQAIVLKREGGVAALVHRVLTCVSSGAAGNNPSDGDSDSHRR